MYLGLDLGTSGLRALLVDASQAFVAEAQATYPTDRPHPGHSEQAPAHWTTACKSVLTELTAKAPAAMADLKGIGVSGQMHGATLLDAQGKVLRPCILWNDTRSAAEAAQLDATPGMRDISGNIVFPGFTAPKLAWVRSHEPDVFAQITKVLLPKDYLNFWLTGVQASETSDSAGTSWLDVGARNWSEQLLTASHMRADQMPPLFEGTQPIGTLRPDLAQELGLPATVTVVAGGGDNAVAACGIGAMNEGDGFVSLGTSGVLLAARDQFAPRPDSAVHTFCHAVPGKWYQMGVLLAATDSLNWLSRMTGQDPANLTAALGDQITAPGKLQFLPYLSGERTPHNDSAIRGAFIGLDIATNQADLTRAVLEGVSFALRDSFEALKSTGAQLDSVIAIGGGSRSQYWLELIATVLNIPLQRPEKGEFGAALGAARLAICGVTGASPDAIMTKPTIGKTILPRRDLASAYDAAYASFRTLYPGIKALTS